MWITSILSDSNMSFKSFRRRFNIKGPGELHTVLTESLNVHYAAADICKKINESEQSRVDKANSTCPSCGSTKIVEKMIGYRYDGFVLGSSLQKCRHCSDCQHDFEETKMEYVWTGNMVSDWYRTLGELIDSGTTLEKIVATIPQLSGIHAESVADLPSMMWTKFDKEDPEKIPLRKLRKIFPSVFDEEQPLPPNA